MYKLRIDLGALVLIAAFNLSGCLTAKERLIDERTGIADPYFIGEYDYQTDKEKGRIRIYSKGNQYVLEENGRLVGLASLHELRDNILVAQRWVAPAVNPMFKGQPEYTYFLIQKTATGFEVGGESLCTESGRETCLMKSRSELMQRLDEQSTQFAVNSKHRIRFIKRE